MGNPEETPENRTVGIDLGTTLTKLAYIDSSGRPVIVPNAEGELLTPSVVVFTKTGVLVGRDARREALSNPSRAVLNVKRQMGNPKWRFKVDGETYTPESISALILKKVVKDAEMHIGPIGRAVITVPAYFDDARRKATEDAGAIAGIEVLDIVNEPTASALAYGLAESGEDGVILVYDLGGGTFDVTVIEKKGNEFITLATDGDVQLGGKDWDERLANHLADEFRREFGADPREDPQALSYLWLSAEEAKKTLSRRECVRVADQGLPGRHPTYDRDGPGRGRHYLGGCGPRDPDGRLHPHADGPAAAARDERQGGQGRGAG